MKRRLVAAALVLVFPFGMAACGAQSKEAACKQIQKAATTASSEINFDANSNENDFKEGLDKALKIYKKAAKKVTNKDEGSGDETALHGNTPSALMMGTVKVYRLKKIYGMVTG